MPSINLKKELYDTLIRKGVPVIPFVNEAVHRKIRNLEDNKQEFTTSQKLYDYLQSQKIDPTLFINQVVKEKLERLEEKEAASKKSSIVYNDDQLSQVIYEHRDELTFLKNGRPSADSMKLIIREHLDGHTLGINRSGALRNQFEIEHPEIKAPDPES